MANKIDILKKEIKLAADHIKELKNNLRKAYGDIIIKCEDNYVHGNGCGKGTKIKNLILIQTHWYVSPYGCTGGDYWKRGECNFICPKCEHRNRLLDNREIFGQYPIRESFREIIEEYDD